MMDSITLYLSGDNRHIAPEVLLKQAANALRNMSLKAGRHEIEIQHDGRVYLNGEKVYEPSRPACAQPPKRSKRRQPAPTSGQLKLALKT